MRYRITYLIQPHIFIAFVNCFRQECVSDIPNRKSSSFDRCKFPCNVVLLRYWFEDVHVEECVGSMSMLT